MNNENDCRRLCIFVTPTSATFERYAYSFKWETGKPRVECFILYLIVIVSSLTFPKRTTDRNNYG